MFRASKALVGVLALDVSLAVRQRIGASANVLDTIGDLLQASSSKHATGYSKLKNELRLAIENRETPGATDSLNEILNQVSADLEAGVETKILAGVSATQAAIDQSVSELTAATTDALGRKSTADADDLSWLSCVGEEKAKREAVEAAQQALAEAEASVIVPCQQQTDRDIFGFKPEMNFEFECSFNAGTCAGEIASYTSQVNDMLSTFTSDSTFATENWNEAKQACDAANADVVVKTGLLADAESTWDGQRNTCLEKHEARTLGMCLFGDSLQQKCQKASAYENLISDADQVNGGVNSQPDREDEWQTVQVVKCMLAKVVAGVDLTPNALTECESTSAVGLPALDKKEAEFAEQTSPANYTCEEETITFNGEIWNVPTGEAPASTSYYKEDFSPAVDLTVGNLAFSFCNSGAPGK